MGDRMIPIPFENLLNHIFSEYKNEKKIFGVKKFFTKKNKTSYSIFGENLETIFGPAAGPHTQLAQNIVAAYVAGSRFFELKTVQTLDGEDLPVAKPCIKADDECYNVEWSTELEVPQAMNEYIKAWILLKVLAKEFGFGNTDGFIFNMSVGYDLKGIQSEKIDTFINGLKDARNTKIWGECISILKQSKEMFNNIDDDFIDSISPNVCRSVTLSTLHGCPPDEIERIATHLISNKGLNTFVKCNPTLLGYEYARKLMDDMGYDYVAFDDFHFNDDLQFEDAVPMLQRLLDLAKSKNLTFGVKLTNTFPVKITNNELPGEEMYMSGRSLYALSMSVAEKLTKAFDGKLSISYSGGADAFNIDNIFEAGIWPITMATTMLKPGGYGRLVQIANKLENKSELLEHKENTEFYGVDLQKIVSLINSAKSDTHHTKSIKPLPNRKNNEPLPMLNCFMAPCSDACPIHQNIPEYTRLAGQKKYKEALSVIMEQNPLPFITGTICSHFCMGKCTRNFYEEAIRIRDTKLECAEKGFDEVLAEIKALPRPEGDKIAVIGGGPGGLAAAYFLARAGKKVTVFEKQSKAGGIVRNVIPEFRISDEAIDKDIALIQAMGVEIFTNIEINDLSALSEQGYKDIVLAIGAYKMDPLEIEGINTIDSLEFLSMCKNKTIEKAENIVIIGGGNTAMDCARAAKRLDSCKSSSLVYRRTKKYMPADEEELLLAIKDGVNIYELASPEKVIDGKLICRKMILGEPDEKGRRKPVSTDETFSIPCDMLVAAISKTVDDTLFNINHIETTNTIRTSKSNVFLVGECLTGPATVVEAIRDAKLVATAITGYNFEENDAPHCDSITENILNKKIILCHSKTVNETNRCLECSSYCGNCVDVCPNRANIAIKVKNNPMEQIVHIDNMCNECGNCYSFCPYAGAPYLDKFTLFENEASMLNSKNNGFYMICDKCFKIRILGSTYDYTVGQESNAPKGITDIIDTIYNDYSYLL